MADDLHQRSTGAALLFLWHRVSPRRRAHFAVAMAVMLLGMLAELITIGAVLPFLALIADSDAVREMPAVGWLADWSGAVTSSQLLLVASGILIGSAVVAAGLRLLLMWVSLGFVLALSHEIGIEVFARILRQPYSYYVSRNSSEVLSGLDKVQTVVWGVLMPGMQALTAVAMALAIIALLFLIHPATTMIAASTFAMAYIGVSFLFRSRLHANSERLALAATQRVQAIQEGLGGIRDILLEQSQEEFESKFRRMDYIYRNSQTVNNFMLLAPRYVIEGVGIVLIAVLALYLSTQSGGIVAAMPVLGALAVGAQRLLPLLQQSYVGWSSLAGNRQVMMDVVDLLNTPTVSSIPRDRSHASEPFQRELALRGVSFSYSGDAFVLRDVDLAIPKGARVGFIGETGSGKSTLLDIVMGLLEPTSGTISVDGMVLDDSSRSAWQGQIAHVPQAIYLADCPIASNIAFGEPPESIDFDRVREAARLAHIDGYISSLPDSYDTLVGERGVRLSGGQRQRIGIARALYKRSALLIFDEATSALDDSTEKAIMTSIAEIGPEVTLLMIAHRTSTLEGCDQIVRMAAGRIVQQGNFDEVIGGRLNARQV